jgi:hypothetical protein
VQALPLALHAIPDPRASHTTEGNRTCPLPHSLNELQFSHSLVSPTPSLSVPPLHVHALPTPVPVCACLAKTHHPCLCICCRGMLTTSLSLPLLHRHPVSPFPPSFPSVHTALPCKLLQSSPDNCRRGQQPYLSLDARKPLPLSVSPPHSFS